MSRSCSQYRTNFALCTLRWISTNLLYLTWAKMLLLSSKNKLNLCSYRSIWWWVSITSLYRILFSCLRLAISCSSWIGLTSFLMFNLTMSTSLVLIRYWFNYLLKALTFELWTVLTPERGAGSMRLLSRDQEMILGVCRVSLSLYVSVR